MTTVLVVDDDVDIARFIEINLRLEGFDVQLAHDGEQALDLIRAGVPDLVLLDVMMPGMSGLDVCRSLRRSSQLSGVPVIMLTARAQESDIAQGFEAGADDYVVKPFSPRELSSRVQAVLDVRMPGLSGIDVCRELHASPSTAALPVILLTARAQEGDVAVGFGAGADDYVVKPFSPRELLSRVEAVLARVRA